MVNSIYVINGKPRSGKDTVVEFIEANVPFRTINISTIDPVNDALRVLGWDGTKTDAYRDLASYLKMKSDLMFDTSFKYIQSICDEFAIIFIHCREPHNIKRICNSLGAKSVYVHRDIDVTCNNDSDNNTDQYNYDYIIKNNGSLSELESTIINFINNVILPNM